MRSDSRLGGYRYPQGGSFNAQNSYVSNRTNGSGVHSEHLRKMMEDV